MAGQGSGHSLSVLVCAPLPRLQVRTAACSELAPVESLFGSGVVSSFHEMKVWRALRVRWL